MKKFHIMRKDYGCHLVSWCGRFFDSLADMAFGLNECLICRKKKDKANSRGETKR